MEICKEWRNQAMAYLDGELPAMERAAFEEHLAGCPTCARVFQEYRQIKEVTKKMKVPEPDPKVWSEYPKGFIESASRGLGWLFYVCGFLIIFVFAIYQFAVSPEDAIAKRGVFSIIIGFVFLFISVLKRRIVEARTDRYSQEVDQ